MQPALKLLLLLWGIRWAAAQTCPGDIVPRPLHRFARINVIVQIIRSEMRLDEVRRLGCAAAAGEVLRDGLGGLTIALVP